MDGGSSVGSGAIADLKAYGAPAEMIAELEAEKETERARDAVIVVEPENVSAVRLFQRMRTSWQRVAISNGRTTVLQHIGFNYAAAPAIAAAINVALDEQLLDDLQFMEATALVIYGRRDAEAFSRAR